jgi:hypothetical protein
MTADEITRESPLIHQLKNHLSIVIGFCDLLLGDMPDTDPKRGDLHEMRNAAQAALKLLPEVATRMR